MSTAAGHLSNAREAQAVFNARTLPTARPSHQALEQGSGWPVHLAAAVVLKMFHKGI
jgi:hypothetical protein